MDRRSIADGFNRPIIRISLLLFLFADLSYSFLQFYHTKLDCDLAEAVLQAGPIQSVMSDPLGMDVLFREKPHMNPNLYVAQWDISLYFKTVPFLFQKFFSPIESIYLSCALIKTIVQALLILILSLFICSGTHMNKNNIVLAAVLITPLFQTFGYNNYMGIITQPVTYLFFYALPISVLLIWIFPFYNSLIHSQSFRLSPIKKAVWLILAIVLPFSGNLIPAIVVIFYFLVLVNCVKLSLIRSEMNFFFAMKKTIRELNREFLFYSILIGLISLYSLLIGSFNILNSINNLSLSERFSRVPAGLFYLITTKPGLPILFIFIFLNMLIIYKQFRGEAQEKLFGILKWTGAFILIYTLLLPFGGFRAYRPNVIKFDTMIPVTCCLIFVYGLTACFLLQNLTGKYKNSYVSLIVVILVIFTFADKPDFDNNACEKNSLEQIAHSSEKIIFINNECSILDWIKKTRPEDSELNAELLKFWGVTKEKKLYFQK